MGHIPGFRASPLSRSSWLLRRNSCMKILVDQNLEVDLVEVLNSHGHEPAHTTTARLETAPDDEILKLCRREKRTLLAARVRSVGACIETTDQPITSVGWASPSVECAP